MSDPYERFVIAPALRLMEKPSNLDETAESSHGVIEYTK
jgi:hypothetical protein